MEHILYIGDNAGGSTSLHRAAALQRLGHHVTHINAGTPVPKHRWARSLAVRTGFRLFAPIINRHVIRSISGQTFDIAWLNCSPEVGPTLLSQIRRCARFVCGYMNDDPFGGRDGRKWDLFKQALPLYDLLVVVRPQNISEAYNAGARKVVRVFMSCDPLSHCPQTLTAAERTKFSSEVVFVGDWFSGRGSFLARLLQKGVPLTIWGEAWQKSRHIAEIRPVWTGRAAKGADYVRVIQSAKVAIGLLNKGNRDLHTQRSSEIPFIGGAVFCAERTAEHELLYQDGREAVFWSSPDECASQCHRLLSDELLRAQIAAAGKRRVEEWRLLNDDVLEAVLRTINGEPPSHPLVRVG